MQISYRGIYHHSSLVQRLRYVSQLLHFLAEKPRNKDVITIKLRDWSISHIDDFTKYKFNTGAAHSKNKIGVTQLAENYLTLSVKFGLLTKISEVFHLSRVGRVLVNILNIYPNEIQNLFFLSDVERIFYTYQLLQQDADTLLTVLNLVQLFEKPNLNTLKQNYYEFYVNRLKTKIMICSIEHNTHQLHDRYRKVTERWKKPESYASYILPPRLNWLLDLGLLDLKKEKNIHIYSLTEFGRSLVENLPILGNSDIPDVTENWFRARFFSEILPLIISSTSYMEWQEVNDDVRMKACKDYLPNAFKRFRKSKTPMMSLTQGAIYLCLRFGIDLKLLTNVEELVQWFQRPHILDNYIYEVRISARENESYIVRRHA